MSLLSIISYLLYFLFFQGKLGGNTEDFKLYGEDFFSFSLIAQSEAQSEEDCEDLSIELKMRQEDQLVFEMKNETAAETAVLVFSDDQLIDQILVQASIEKQLELKYELTEKHNSLCVLQLQIQENPGFVECNPANNSLQVKL